MKIKVEFEIDDKVQEFWDISDRGYYMEIYDGDAEKVNKIMSEYNYKTTIMNTLEDLIYNSIDGAYNCKVNII